MVNYSNGKIYKIEPIWDHEEGDIYIGSTTKQYLSQRMDTHRSDYKRWLNGKQQLTRSYLIFEKYGLENCTIVLVENVCANSKDELLSRERHYIETLKCINKCIPGRQKEFGEVAYNKMYRIENKEFLAVQKKEYYAKNKDSIIEKATKYNRENKDKRAITCKKYYLKKKTQITQKVQCDTCCCFVSKMHIKRHEQSQKHQHNLHTYEYEYEYNWTDGTPCSEQEYYDSLI